MKETFPSNPSEAFAAASVERDGGQYESVLDAEEAAYAAKPWMDVAVDLHDAKNNAEYVILDEGETVYNAGLQGSLDELVEYGERRARAAAEGKRGNELSSDEAPLLDAYKAEADMNRAKAGYNDETLTEGQMRQAHKEAIDRRKAALERGDTAGAKRWLDVARLASDYEDFHTGEVDEDDESAVTQRIFPDARNAGFVLSNLDEDGAIRVDPTNLRFARHNVPQDIHNMQRMTDVYELFGEIQTREVQARKEQTLKKYGEYKDVHDAAEETLDYDAMLDDGEDGFAAARQKIENQLQNYRGQGAAGEFHVKHFELLQDALSAYAKESERGNYSFPAASHDLKAARGRSEILKFLANQYPKQEKPSSHQTEPTSQSQTRERTESPEAAVFREVLAAAKNNTYIHTDMPRVAVKVGATTEDMGGRGFQSFGSHADARTSRFEGVLGVNTGVPEMIQFADAKSEPVYKELVKKNRWGKVVGTDKAIAGYQDVPLPPVTNPITGQQEPGVTFRYMFTSQTMNGYPGSPTDYMTNSTGTVGAGRPGNLLKVETTLPKSIANHLEQLIRDNPASVREIVHQLVTTEGGVPENVWDGSRSGVARMSPPYDKLPDGWTIGLYGNQVLARGDDQHSTLSV